MRDEKIDFIHVDLSTWRNQIKKELKENHSRIVFNDEIEEILGLTFEEMKDAISK